MNERIKELHMQAQQEAFDEPIDIENCAVEDIKGFSQQVYEKFAELIVKECFDVVIADGRFHDAKGVIRAGKGVAMEHFGVEE
jgi:hypothetical protein